jgi:hypothetical protein
MVQIAVSTRSLFSSHACLGLRLAYRQILMRLLVQMTRPYPDVEPYETFECVVRRLIGPVLHRDSRHGFIFVDIDLPEKYVDLARPRDWNPDGTYRVEAMVRHNRRSLAAFILSGEPEWSPA